MKKFIRLLSASMAAFVLVSAGCGRTTKADEERNLEEKLKEKYGEEFTVIKSYISDPYWWDEAPGSLEATCCLKDDESMVFEATYGLSDHAVWDDSYIQTVLEKQMTADLELFLSDWYNDYAVQTWVMKPNMQTYEEAKKYTAFTSADDVTISSYEEKYGEKMDVVFYIVFNLNEIQNYEEIKEVFEKNSEQFNDAVIYYYCFFANSEKIEKCREALKSKDCRFYELEEQMETETEPVYWYKRSKDEGFYLCRLKDDDGIKIFNSDGTIKQ